MTADGYEQAASERKAALLAALDGCKVRKPVTRGKRPVSAIVLRSSRDKRHVSGRAWSMCAKKNAYDSRRDCERVIQRALEERGVRLRYYACDRCGKYHITKCFREGE